jgi:Cu-processing system permease protein
MYATSYIYNSAEFVELLLSQPLKRSKIWISLYVGLVLAFGFAFLIGMGLPIFFYAFSAVGCMMLITGMLVSIIFVSLAMFCSILMRDKAKGIGVSIMVWLFFALLFDGIVLFLLFQLSEYPIEKMMIGISALNPISLARILILLHLDVSAMMGYTGAIFKNFFGTTLGIFISMLVLLLWVFIPFSISLLKFKKRDL